MINYRSLSLLICAAVLSFSLFTAAENIPHPVPREHPRLMGSGERLKKLAAEHGSAYARTRKAAFSPKTNRFTRMMSLALVCAVDSDEKAGKEAVKMAMKIAGGPVRVGHETFGTDLALCAFAYDFCFDYWTDSQRAKFIDFFHRTVDANIRSETHVFHNGWYAYKNWGIGMAAYAVYYDDPRAPKILENLHTDYRTRAAPALEFAGDGGGFAEGYYRNYFMLEWTLFCEAVRWCEGIDYYELAPKYFRNAAVSMMFETYPGFTRDGRKELIPMGDGGGGNYDEFLVPRRIIVSHYRDDPSNRVVNTFNEQTPNCRSFNGFMDVLWNDTSVPRGDLEHFKLSHVSPGPGYVYARSSWKPDATYFFFKCGDRFTAHQHLDNGHFLIYKYASLAGDGGQYDSFASKHAVNYYCRTIAHSTILVYDPSEKWPAIRSGKVSSNDGGQHHDFRHHNGAIKDIADWEAQKNSVEIADLSAYEDRGAYMYVAGNCTRAYRASKMREFTRQIVYIRPDTFVIFDRVRSTRPDYKKSWVLQAMKVPEKKDGYLVITNGQGRLFVQTLLPADSEVSLFYGKDLYRVGDVVYNPKLIKLTAPECRVEISPARPAEFDLFLHVLTAAPSGTQSVPPARYKMKGGVVEVSAAGCRIRFGVNKVGGEITTRGGAVFTLADKIVKDGSSPRKPVWQTSSKPFKLVAAPRKKFPKPDEKRAAELRTELIRDIVAAVEAGFDSKFRFSLFGKVQQVSIGEVGEETVSLELEDDFVELEWKDMGQAEFSAVIEAVFARPSPALAGKIAEYYAAAGDREAFKRLEAKAENLSPEHLSAVDALLQKKVEPGKSPADTALDK